MIFNSILNYPKLSIEASDRIQIFFILNMAGTNYAPPLPLLVHLFKIAKKIRGKILFKKANIFDGNLSVALLVCLGLVLKY